MDHALLPYKRTDSTVAVKKRSLSALEMSDFHIFSIPLSAVHAFAFLTLMSFAVLITKDPRYLKSSTLFISSSSSAFKVAFKEDKQATWNVINMALGKKRKKTNHPEQITTGDPLNPTKTKCPQDIAMLTNHFTSVAKNLAGNLAKTNCKHSDFIGKENKATMYLKFIELYEIPEEINKICIKKATGCDEIAPKILKWAAELFAPVLLIIFNPILHGGGSNVPATF